MMFWYIIAGLSIIGFMVPMYIGTIRCTNDIRNRNSGALIPFLHLSGSASAVIGWCQFVLASIVGTFIMKF